MNREVDFFSQYISNSDCQAGLIVVGSSIEKQVDEHKDIDLLALSNDRELKDKLKNTEGYVDEIDNSLRLMIANQEIGILICSPDSFRQRVAAVLNGNLDLIYKEWAIGAEFPEGFLGDIKKSHTILETPEKDIENIKRQIDPYPEHLKEKLALHCKKELLLRIQQLEKASKRNDNNSILILKGHIIYMIMRLTYSAQNEYFQGVKSLKYHKNIESLLHNTIQEIRQVRNAEIPELCIYLRKKYL